MKLGYYLKTKHSAKEKQSPLVPIDWARRPRRFVTENTDLKIK